MTSFSSLLASLSLLLLLLPAVLSQYHVYTAGPILWHTFDAQPRSTHIGNLTDFVWTAGRNPHYGNAFFNGNSSRIDLMTFQDDQSRVAPRRLPQTLSLEFWASWSQLTYWSRLLDCGQGRDLDNIYVANVETSSTLIANFWNNATSQDVTGYQQVHPNSWQHIVSTITKQSWNWWNESATIDLYVDGVRVGHNPNAMLPRDVERRWCWLGKSNWDWDRDFVGWIDDFFLYDYPLSPEAVLAHLVLPRPPVYELTFSTDPRRIFFGRPNNFFTYQWTNVDERDSSNITAYHDGHLRLIGDSYIDLAAAAQEFDPSSIGAAPLPVIGGPSGGDGTVPNGWSIEVLFKADTVERFAKVFDFGNGIERDNILLGYVLNDPILRLEQFVEGVQWYMPCLDPVVLHTWYHVVVVFHKQRWNSDRGNATCYVNGNLTFTDSNAPMPMPVRRNTAYIGKSHWPDEYFDMFLDTFRLYDYALLGSEIKKLYQATHEPLPQDNSGSVHDYTYHTAPIASYTFPRATTQEERELGTHYNWTRGTYSSNAFPHIGVAHFDGGVNSYVTLSTFHSDEGTLLPNYLGPTISFETWCRWDALTLWARIFDLGGVSGYADNNIVLASFGDTDTLHFEVYSGGFQTYVQVPNAIVLRQWMHIVAVAEQRFVNDTSSSSSAVLRIFINGVLMNAVLGYAPARVNRPSQLMALSNWPNDTPLVGAIDSLYVYDKVLDYEEVGAHYISFKPPVFELAFARDPLPWLGLDRNDPFVSYSWEAFDPADQLTNATQYHNGHLRLVGDSWVNLSASTGPNSVGTTIPPILFGTQRSSGATWGASFVGWTIEITVKVLQQETGVKIFDFGNGGGGALGNNIGLGYWNGVNRLNLHVYNAQYPNGEHFPVVNNVVPGQWYHIVITMTPRGQGTGRGSFNAWVNGEWQPGDDDHAYPAGVVRRLCYLGKSNWEEGYFDMLLDTFRIYDYVVTADQAAALYSLTTQPLTGVARPLYDTAPLAQYSFDVEPDETMLFAGTKFSWSLRDAWMNPNHTGLAHFNGVDEWVNLMTFPDNRGLSFPTYFGNTSVSFEAWVMFEDFRDYSRVFDFGNGAGGHNVLLANQGASANLAFHVYPGLPSGISTQINTPNPIWVNGTWQHVVVSVEDLGRNPGVDRYGPQGAHYRVYINAREVASMLGYLPPRIERTFAYLGQSNWPNALFTGYMDSFYFYNYALSAEQVAVRYILPRFPVFDLSFSHDPRPWLSQYAPQSYGWQDFDPRDNYANNSLYHSGHLVLTGSRSPHSFVNLSTPVGPNSVGVVLPRIGGDSQGSGNTIPGWTFEFIVKVNSREVWAKLIDWGNGADADNIILGYQADSSRLDFQVYNSVRGPTANSAFGVVPNVVFGEWYHIAIVITPISVSGFTSVWRAYLDGRLINTAQDMILPQSVRRNSALIGRSNWEWNNDGMFAANVDAIRVYDYALTAQQVAAIYALSNDPNGTPRPIQAFASSSSSSSSSTGGAMRRSSSSSSPIGVRPKSCQWWSPDRVEPCRCPFGGTYPNKCWCEYVDGYIPYDCPNEFPDYDDGWGYVSSTGSSGGGSSGMGTATIAAIIFVVVAIVAVAAFIYYRYFRRPATSDILHLGVGNAAGGSDGKEGLLAHYTNGSSGTNGSTNGNGSHLQHGQGQHSAATGLDYYLAPPDATTQATPVQPLDADSHAEVKPPVV